jgi:hypothetical protein
MAIKMGLLAWPVGPKMGLLHGQETMHDLLLVCCMASSLESSG